MSRDTATNVHPLTLNPLTWLTNRHGATILAVVVAAFVAAMPLPGQQWGLATAGMGGMILWPLFGATNQLLGGLAFMVILFYLWRRGKPVWFIIIPGVFMLIMPAWAMLWSMFVQAPGAATSWWADGNWLLLSIGMATIALEVWMIVEASLMFPKVRNVLETSVEPERRGFEVVRPAAGATRT
jgi:carbon starvation protein